MAFATAEPPYPSVLAVVFARRVLIVVRVANLPHCKPPSACAMHTQDHTAAPSLFSHSCRERQNLPLTCHDKKSLKTIPLHTSCKYCDDTTHLACSRSLQPLSAQNCAQSTFRAPQIDALKMVSSSNVPLCHVQKRLEDSKRRWSKSGTPNLTNKRGKPCKEWPPKV